jgi:hypothetical protein
VQKGELHVTSNLLQLNKDELFFPFRTSEWEREGGGGGGAAALLCCSKLFVMGCYTEAQP